MKKVLVLIPLFALLAFGCSKPGLEGKWTMSGGPMIKNNTTGTITYTGNRFTLVMDVAQVGLKVTTTGSYKLEGEKLSQTTDDVTVDDSKVAAQFKAMIKAVVIPAKLKETMNADKSSAIKFTDADKVVLTGGKDGDVTLTRVKSS